MSKEYGTHVPTVDPAEARSVHPFYRRTGSHYPCTFCGASVEDGSQHDCENRLRVKVPVVDKSGPARVYPWWLLDAVLILCGIAIGWLWARR